MAATLVQTKDAAQNTGQATTAATWDTAATAGNLLLLSVAADDYAATPPSGWTESTGCKQETFLGHYLWWKVAAGGETSVNYTIGSASPSCWITAEYSGLTSTPYDISSGQFAQSSGSTYTTPNLTPTSGDRLIIASMGASSGGAWSSLDVTTWLNSFTEVADIGTTLGSGTRDIQGVASLAVTANGSTAYSSGATYPSVAQSRTGIIIAFKVAAAGGGTVRPPQIRLPQSMIRAAFY